MTHFGSVQTDQYDGFGLRAVKVTTATLPQDAGTTYFLYDGDQQIAGVNVLDHTVIGDGVFVSLKERGLV